MFVRRLLQLLQRSVNGRPAGKGRIVLHRKTDLQKMSITWSITYCMEEESVGRRLTLFSVNYIIKSVRMRRHPLLEKVRKGS